jgi:hypothetical protein
VESQFSNESDSSLSPETPTLTDSPSSTDSSGDRTIQMSTIEDKQFLNSNISVVQASTAPRRVLPNYHAVPNFSSALAKIHPSLNRLVFVLALSWNLLPVLLSARSPVSFRNLQNSGRRRPSSRTTFIGIGTWYVKGSYLNTRRGLAREMKERKTTELYALRAVIPRTNAAMRNQVTLQISYRAHFQSLPLPVQIGTLLYILGNELSD